MIKIPFSEEEREQLNYLRFHHPHPRVRKKMEVLWLHCQNLPHKEIARSDTDNSKYYGDLFL